VNQQSRGQHNKQSLQGVLTSHKASHKESKQATYLPLFCRCFADLIGIHNTQTEQQEAMTRLYNNKQSQNKQKGTSCNPNM
jgi:hypothetical protein